LRGVVVAQWLARVIHAYRKSEFRFEPLVRVRVRPLDAERRRDEAKHA
jgi:hypothetical protein